MIVGLISGVAAVSTKMLSQGGLRRWRQNKLQWEKEAEWTSSACILGRCSPQPGLGSHHSGSERSPCHKHGSHASLLSPWCKSYLFSDSCPDHQSRARSEAFSPQPLPAPPREFFSATTNRSTVIQVPTSFLLLLSLKITSHGGRLFGSWVIPSI